MAHPAFQRRPEAPLPAVEWHTGRSNGDPKLHFPGRMATPTEPADRGSPCVCPSVTPPIGILDGLASRSRGGKTEPRGRR
jgi:hypothetical protein